VADLEVIIPPVSCPAEKSAAGRDRDQLKVTEATVTFAQLRDFCSCSKLTVAEDEEEEDRPEARLKSVLDDILQSVKGDSLVETVDCY
jgi:hypothetical protein